MVAQPVWRLSRLSAPQLTLVPATSPVISTDHAAAIPSGIPTPAWASAHA